MKALRLFVLLASAFAGPALAGPRSSPHYAVASDTADSAGKRSTSADYTMDGSLGGIAGVSTVAVPAETAKHGYIGQLYEVTALQLDATPTTVNEGATRQISAVQVLDDATTIQVLPGAITWSVQGGPLTGIDSNGLATAAPVFENTAATVQGIHAGLIGTLGLTVLDSIADNYGTYAADGLGDDWQVQYFGLNNANAAPLLDPDFDGQANLFEFTAGLVPTDPNSSFRLTIQPVPGQPGLKQIVFSPRWADRSYSILTSATLQGSPWTPLTGGAVSDDGTQRTITDPDGSGERKFYKVEIVKP